MRTIEVSVLVSAITAMVAVAGLVASVVFSYFARRDSSRVERFGRLNSGAQLLSSAKPGERAVGVEIASSHMDDALIGLAAQRMIVSAIHLEHDPLIAHRAASSLLQNSEVTRAAIAQLLDLNRVLWRDLRTTFASSLRDDDGGVSQHRKNESDEILKRLLRNRIAMSRLLAGLFMLDPPIRDIDFSETFYPDLRLTGLELRDCNFQRALLHHVSGLDARFVGCDFRESILIGSYMEGVSFTRCDLRGGVLTGDALTGARGSPDVPREVIDHWSNCSAFMWQEEYDWRGHWASKDKACTEYTAIWRGGSREVKAQIRHIDRRRLIRYRSSDENNGEYTILRMHKLDRHRNVELVGGMRTLSDGVPAVWLGVWWRRLTGAGRRRKRAVWRDGLSPWRDARRALGRVLP